MKATSPEDISGLSTILDFIRWASSRFTMEKLFYGHGTANAWDDAMALVLHSIHQPYDLPALYFSATLTRAEQKKICDRVDRRINEKIPTAYLTHDAIFAGLSFYVDQRVLIPRSPIAELIEEQFSPWVDPHLVGNILDLCTGSACIAVACACNFPDAGIDAIDISDQALEVAKINVERHGCTEQVELIQSDLFESLTGRHYDVIVSNPPYVCRAEWEQLPKEYAAEPEIGFDGGLSGLDIVIRLLAIAGDYLNDKGILIVEVGSSAEALQDRFPDVPFFWLEFEHGGDGVFLLTAEQIQEMSGYFTNALKEMELRNVHKIT